MTLRVLVVTESFLPQLNGVTNSVRRVLEHLSGEGHQALVVAPTGPDVYAGFRVVRARGARPWFYKDFRVGLETRGRLRTVMRGFRPDVVHLASPLTLGYQAVKVANELGVPSVAIYQTDMVGFAEQYHVVGVPSLFAKLTRAVHADVDRTLAPSTASLAQLERLGVRRTALWPRGVDIEAFHPSRVDHELRARWAPDGETIVGYVGRLAPEKELELLAGLDAMPGISLVVVGSGPSEAHLRQVLPHARFTGQLQGDPLGAAYASLDVFVHTGRHETFGQTLQEALASGVPVVAPRAGGPVDIVRDHVTGFLYRPGDAADLERHVGRLARDQLLRRRMGRDARQSVAGKSWAAVNAALVEHYREVTAERGATRLTA